jgi:hypothetical protein
MEMLVSWRRFSEFDQILTGETCHPGAGVAGELGECPLQDVTASLPARRLGADGALF